MQQTPYTAIPCGMVITETLPISIFLAVSTVNKVSYKLYRRGLFECSSPRSRRAHEFRSLYQVCRNFINSTASMIEIGSVSV